MMRRQLYSSLGLIVLLSVLAIHTECLADSTYRVKSGSNLYSIAKKHGVSVDAIRQANNLSSDRLKPGQVLTIPSKSSKRASRASVKSTKVSTAGKTATAKTKTYTIKSGDTLAGISKKTGIPLAQLKKLNHLRANRLKPGDRIVLARAASGAQHSERDESRRLAAAIRDEGEMEEDDGLTADSQEDVAEVEKDMISSAELLGNWKDPEEQRLFVKVVKGFLGAPYRFGGSTVRGIDCSGFVAKIYQFFDVNLPRTAREQSRVGMNVDKDNLDVGDLVFFNTRRAFGHVGIYIGNNQFIHAAAGKKREVSISNLDEPYYSKRFVKAVRLKGKEKEQAKTGNGSV
ncbi:MAG: LysM peptidoglycan-binding domain-containing protein [Syntrophaceae bacterium]|nr:LysM peptidoglycan-binding domain-containing protein [Syntrophaceae bacterium]